MAIGRMILVAAALVGAPLAGAAAAPQILQLVATNGAIELVCDHGTCAAEFTTMCLQQERNGPVDGTEYLVLEGSDIAVEFTRADGSVRRLPAAAMGLTFKTVRAYLAMEITLPQNEYREYDATSAAISVGRNAFLVPRPVADDPQPITTAEIKQVTGRHAAIARSFQSDFETELAIARITNELINALPAEPPYGYRRQETARAGVPDAALARIAGREPNAGARKGALESYRTCRLEMFVERYGSVRRCLERQHDRIMDYVNHQYW